MKVFKGQRVSRLITVTLTKLTAKMTVAIAKTTGLTPYLIIP
jgi:hypothetical protein